MKYNSEFSHGIMIHYVHDENNPPVGQGSISVKTFEKILKFAGIENFLEPIDWLNKLEKGKLRKKDLCITFDDGLKCQYDICMPILEKYDLKCFWFVYSSVFEGNISKFAIYSCFIVRYFKNINDFYNLFFSKFKKNEFKIHDNKKLEDFVNAGKLQYPFYSVNDLKYRFIRNYVLTKNDYENLMEGIMAEMNVSMKKIAKELWLTNFHIRKLSKEGHNIGLHSYDHLFTFSALSIEKQKEQYKKNIKHIRRICKKEITSMSHPLNSYNDDTLEILNEMKIKCGFRSNMLPPPRKKINPNCLEIAREDITNILKRMSK